MTTAQPSVPSPQSTSGAPAASQTTVELNLPAKDIDPAERIRRLEEMIGIPESHAGIFAKAIREHTHKLYDKYVEPLFAAHWPEKAGEADGKKLRFLACNLYAAAPYTVLFCAERPHWLIKLATATGNIFGLSSSSLNKGAAFAMKLFGSAFPERDHRRIVYIAAFIATIDHAFDHYMDDVDPKERERRIKGLLDGSWDPDHGSLKLTRAIQEAMSQDLNAEEKPIFDAALARVVEWVESEVQGMTGIEDPRGLCHRLAGVEGTIDGLIFPVHRYAGKRAHQWMYDVSLFVQMMDDWIDYEADLKDIRSTPVIAGKWNLGVIRQKWEDTTRGVEQLAAEAGMTSPAYQKFVREAYVYQMRDVMDAMIHGVAA